MIKWIWTMKKPQVPLAWGLHVISIPFMQRNLGMDIDFPMKIIGGDAYFDKEVITKIEKEIAVKITEDNTYPDQIESKIHVAVQNVRNIVDILGGQRVSDLKNEELLDFFFRGYQSIAELAAFMSFKGTVQMNNVLEKKIRILIANRVPNREQADDLFLLFSLPVEDSFMSKERQSIMQVAQINDDQKQNDALSGHTARFGWMGVVMYKGRPYDINHFKDELTALDLDAGDKLSHMQKQRHSAEEKISRLKTEMSLNNDELELLRQFRNWTHLRTYVKDMTSVGMEATIPYLDEIAKRVGCSYEDLIHLSNAELTEIFERTEELMVEVEKRKKAWGALLIRGESTYFNSETLEKIREKEETIPSGVKGFVAFRQGTVSGKAVVVNNVDDLGNIKKGDVLITHMTTTNFVPYLSKVAAIVTDEGGISCHAAIIAREMSIPCIIGTHLGTKAFKSGDQVEVDTNNGIVKRII